MHAPQSPPRWASSPQFSAAFCLLGFLPHVDKRFSEWTAQQRPRDSVENTKDGGCCCVGTRKIKKITRGSLEHVRDRGLQIARAREAHQSPEDNLQVKSNLLTIVTARCRRA